MDEYGGPAAPPRPPKPAARVHRSSGAAGARPHVSLLRPRPEAERERNAYVEAPCRAPPAAQSHASRPLKPVTSQPGAADKRRVLATEPIVCEACGRCRCEQCARPRPLPSRWLCGSCLCSAEACVDYASCMCCVKALFYHCGSGEEEASEPCACGPRLWCVGALALPLPCLCLYWPLRVRGGGRGGVRARLAGRLPLLPPGGRSAARRRRRRRRAALQYYLVPQACALRSTPPRTRCTNIYWRTCRSAREDSGPQ